MKKLLMFVVVIWVVSSGWSLAAEPVDSYVKSALSDIERYEKQFAGKTSANASTVKRSLKLLGLTRGRLDQSSNKSHESWVEADQRYKVLVDKLNGLLSGGDSANTPATEGAGNAQKTAPGAAQTAALAIDPVYQERVALVKEVEATAALYEANYQKALALVRMPKAATTDAELTRIARETLSQYDTVGEIKRLVINAEKQHRTKETSEEKFTDIDVSLSGTVTLSGTKTTYFYEWDQFQVATAEPVGDKYHIFYTTLKYFTSGATTTPLNRWIVSGRLQGCEIPKANIDK